MRTDTFSEETKHKYEGSHLWKPWMSEIRLIQIEDLDELRELLDLNSEKNLISWDVETKSLDNSPENVCGHCIAFTPTEGYYIPTDHINFPSKNLPKQETTELLLDFIDKREVAVYNWMFEGRIYRMSGRTKYCTPGEVADVMIYRWLSNSDKKQFNLKDAAEELCGKEMLRIQEVPGAKIGKKANEIGFHLSDPEDATLYAAADPVFTLAIYDLLREKIQSEQSFILKLEHNLVDMLLDMEKCPISIDRGYLRQAREELTHWISVVSNKIYNEAGVEFDIGSNREVGKVLTRLGIKLDKTDKGNDATGKKSLENLVPEYPIVENIFFYRSLVKERSTYVDALLNHTSEEKPEAVFKFKSVGAPTGRLASGGVDEGDLVYAPMNVQAIPSSSKYRKANCHLVKNPPASLRAN